MPRVDYACYYLYDELVETLHAFAEEYPQLARLSSIGKSYEGRDLWLMTITNSAAGAADEKPAYWLDGNIHATEVTGSMAALHVIDRLLTGYGTDEQVTHLLDRFAFYILPRFNPDGAERALTRPQYLRSSVRPYPYADERDGLYPEDIDGDGRILQMRIQDPNGPWKISDKDPRLMVRRRPDEFGGTYYRIYTEGLIRNFDGVNVKIAPPFMGLDINRNFPFEWEPEAQQKGAGPYPTSEPEVRAVVQFITEHPNIFGAVTYHTYSGAILRPYGTVSDDVFDVHDLRVFKLIGQRGTELTGYPCVSVYHGFRYHPKQTIKGVFDDWAYDQLGIFAYTVELWDMIGEAGIKEREFIEWFKDHPEEDDLKLLRWNDEHLNGEGFVNWRPFDHPQLGKVEIGGWYTMYTFRNPPHTFLEETCRKNTEFILAHAATGPRLALREFWARHLGEDLFYVRAVLVNEGFLPTYGSNKAKERQAVRPIEVTLTLPDGAELELGERQQEVGQLEGRSNKMNVDFPTDNVRMVEWLVRAPKGGRVGISAIAPRAGTVRGEVALER